MSKSIERPNQRMSTRERIIQAVKNRRNTPRCPSLSRARAIESTRRMINRTDR